MSPLDTLLVLAGATLAVSVLAGNCLWGARAAVFLYLAQLAELARIQPLVSGHQGVVAAAARFSVVGNPVHWELNGLGWFFAVITVGAALFSAWFTAGDWGRERPGGRLLHGSLAANVLAMLLLLASHDLLTLFIGWELVSWASFLMMTQAGGAAARAAFRYLVYAISGAMAILAAIVLLQTKAGSLDYASVQAALAHAGNGTVWVVMLLLGAGFAVKMGLVPFHLWQAQAYGETPGPGAAFMGAISSRMGLFGLLILLVQLVGFGRLVELVVPFTWLDARELWAWLAAITIVVPTFIALTQSDARLLLAWHGIGQGGFMLLGVMVGTPMGVSGGLMHVFNHASYQAPLFLAVSAVVYRTGTADLDRLGGLISRMPLSYVAMLVGIIGLAGLPPMNGFVSKWLIYKALLDAHMPLLFVASVVGTLGTILSVYKLIHNIFLGQLRMEHAAVKEVPPSMSVPMLVLAGIVFVTGFMPGLALALVAVAQQALGVPALAYHLGGVVWPTGSLNMLWVVGGLLGAIGFGALVFLGANPSHRTHQLDNYAGGHFLTADVRYHYSHDFYAGLLRLIGPWFRGGVQWAEDGLVSFTNLLASAMHGLYRSAYTPVYLLVAVVLGLWAVLGAGA